MNKEKAYIKIEMNDKNEIKIDTNLTSTGAIHLLATSTQVIVEKNLESLVEEEKQGENKIIEQ